MSLIEKLGGYEPAKRAIENDVLKDYAPYTYETAQRELLEYRRANDIFEEGDRVVFLMSYHSAMICSYGDGCQLHGEVRHATDEEIKAGHRL